MKFFSPVFYRYIPIIMVIVSLNACEDIVEPDIKNLTINLVSPADSSSSASSSLLFIWDEIKGAQKYQIQIASPNFSTIQQLLVDSNVSGTKFNYTLQAGAYQWRVRGVNGGGTTAYSTRTISVDSSSNISSQMLMLTDPADNYFTNKSTNVFKWNLLANAQDYRFQVVNNTSGSSVVDVILETDSFQYTLSEGVYKWQVRAQNTLSNTAYSSRTITIDQTAPAASAPSSPIDNSNINSPVALSWTKDASAIADSLFINTDSLFVTTPFYKGYHTATSYTMTGVMGQKYFWRLKSRDQAGNWSDYGQYFGFKVQ